MIYAATTGQIKEKILNYDHYIYGAGNKLKAFLDFYEDTGAIYHIQGIIDEDKNKQGTTINIKGRSIKIISLNDVDLTIKYYFVTNYEYSSIVKELEERLKNIDIFVCRLIDAAEENERNKSVKKPDNIRIYEDRLIPSTINYCWFGPGEIPDKCKNYMESWSKYCPSYEIVLWNENNYDVTKNPFIKKAYEAGKYAFVSDYARLDIIYNNGGIYLDVDVELLKPLDDLLFQKGYAGVEKDNYVNLGLGFGAEKGLKIIKHLRDDYLGLTFNLEKMDEFTCPKIQTKTLESYGYVANGDYQIIEGISIFPQSYFSGTDYQFYIENIHKECFSIHHYEASWVDKKTKEKLELLKYIGNKIKYYY
jgi:hypothetical protein